MDDAVRVSVIETRGDASQVPEGGRLVEPSIRHPGGEASARDVLDHHVGRSLESAEVVDVDDVRVPELGDGLRLMPEPRDAVAVRRQRVHDLYRAGPLELRMVAAVDHAHGAFAYEVLDLILPQPRPGRDRQGS